MDFSTIKEVAHKYRYAIFLMYYPLYLFAFNVIEKITPNDLYIIRCPLDQYIPFVEVFVIPYIFWFVYIGGAVVWLYFFDREIMCKLLWCGMIGMTAFIIISVLIPNGLDLRPAIFERDNIFVQLTKYVYSMDTSTNVFPSIHVNNSICACVALLSSDKIRKNNAARVFVIVAAVLIILSTLFLKQHSVIDATAGAVTAAISCEICFGSHIREMAEELRYEFNKRKRAYLKMMQ